MGILDRLIESLGLVRQDELRELRALSLTDYKQWVETGIIQPSAAGVNVTENKAMTYSAIFGCVRILAETVAAMPLIVYERLDQGKKRATEHYLYPLLHDAPNGEMTSFEYRELLQGHLALWGNAYSHISYDNRGRVQQLFPFRPDKLAQTGYDNQGQLWYEFMMPDNSMQWFPKAQIWHLKGLGSDGVFGYSPIRLLKQGIGLGLAAEEFGARFFGNGAVMTGLLKHPGILGEEAYKRLQKDWQEKHGGLSQSHKTAILEEGLDYVRLGVPPDEGQFLETRTFQVRDIARAYRIPLHMLADLERASFSNIEQQSIEFVIYTMLPWFVRWEQSIKQNLMLERDRPVFFAEFLADALQRGDTESRYKAYAVARQNGWMNADEIRELENMNPIPDGGGQTYLVPLNMIPASSAGAGFAEEGRIANGGRLTNGRAQPRTRGPAPTRELRQRRVASRLRLRRVYNPLIIEAAGRVFRREANDVANAARRFIKNNDIQGFRQWLLEFYREHQEFASRAMRPVMQAYGELVAPEAAGELGAEHDPEEVERYVNRYADGWAARNATKSMNMVDSALAQEEIEPALDATWDRWRNERPEDTGREESVRVGEAVAGFVWLMAGATAITWHAVGDSCPYCTGLDGRTVGIQQNFISANTDFQPDGAEAPLRSGTNISHAPAHNGCDCYTTAG